MVRGASRNLLGVDEIHRLNLIAVVNSLTTKDASFNLFEAYLKLFTLRSIPVGLRDKAHARLQEMLAQGVISEVEEPTAWCSGLTIAPKANNDIRLCVELTRLNKGVRREAFPLPRISDSISQVSQGRVFSKLDANSGFWQVKLEPGCRLLMTFITPWGEDSALIECPLAYHRPQSSFSVQWKRSFGD